MSKKGYFSLGEVLGVFHCHTHITLRSCFPLLNSIVEQALLCGPVGGDHGTQSTRANLAGCFAEGSQILFLMLNLPRAPFLPLLFTS